VAELAKIKSICQNNFKTILQTRLVFHNNEQTRLANLNGIGDKINLGFCVSILSNKDGPR
jgi:hypothetical protein